MFIVFMPETSRELLGSTKTLIQLDR
jgi:hypothetical protein